MAVEGSFSRLAYSSLHICARAICIRGSILVLTTVGTKIFCSIAVTKNGGGQFSKPIMKLMNLYRRHQIAHMRPLCTVQYYQDLLSVHCHGN